MCFVYYSTLLLYSATREYIGQVNTDTINSRLGDNLKKIRTKKGMSQGDIASKIGADRAYISGIENGKRNVTLSTVARLAQALEISSDDLLK
ncbi:MAG: helix-turn-helix transcriptional regulator [Patescibacteria group bacterium]